MLTPNYAPPQRGIVVNAKKIRGHARACCCIQRPWRRAGRLFATTIAITIIRSSPISREHEMDWGPKNRLVGSRTSPMYKIADRLWWDLGANPSMLGSPFAVLGYAIGRRSIARLVCCTSRPAIGRPRSHQGVGVAFILRTVGVANVAYAFRLTMPARLCQTPGRTLHGPARQIPYDNRQAESFHEDTPRFRKRVCI